VRAASGGSDLWLHEIERATETRFTFHPSTNYRPIWFPDGGRIVFASNRSGAYDLYQKSAGGAGQEELLLKSDASKDPLQWSRDGRFLVYTVRDNKTRSDLWVLPMQGDRKPVPFLQTEFMETLEQSPRTAAGWPTRRWSRAKWKVSTAGGRASRWRQDGKELFYLDAGGRLMTVAVKTAAKSAFEMGAPEPLFGCFALLRTTGRRRPPPEAGIAPAA